MYQSVRTSANEKSDWLSVTAKVIFLIIWLIYLVVLSLKVININWPFI